jgi:type IV secretory pathway VirB6-like protein
MLKDYESLRWKPTASITAKSIFLGYLETGGNGFPSIFRDAFFFSAGKLGIAKKVYLDAATPQVLSEEIDR